MAAVWKCRALLMSLFFLFVSSATGQNVQVRLVGGPNERQGRVEVYYNRTWGTICKDGWDVSDAAVVCRMLGYVGLAEAITNSAQFGPGSGRIWLDSVDCTGNEESIAQCPQLGWGVNDCTHADDAGVACLGDKAETSTVPGRRTSTTTLPPRICDNPSRDVRLVDGPSLAEGRVQVRRSGQWGAVCDDRWGLEDAKVICRMLCYNPDNARAHLGGRYGNATLPYLLDEVQCLGEEDTIGDCPKNPWGIHDCEPTEAAGVSCIQEDPGPPGLPQPEVSCFDSTITVTFDLLKEPRLEPRFLSVFEADANCDYETLEENDYVIMKIPFIGCGTTRTDNDTHIIYENRVRHAVPAPSTVFTRTTVYYIPVICIMPRQGDPGNNIEPEARTAPPVRGKGAFDVRMFFYLNNRLSQPVQRFPARVTLGEVVYVAMSLFSTDRDLKLIIPHCWATAEREPDSEPQVDLIKDKCINEESVNFYPVNDTMFAFRFQSFKFLGDYPYIYVHCDGYVCGLNEKTPECDRSCGTPDPPNLRRRRRRQASFPLFDSNEIFNVNEGPLVAIESTEDVMMENDMAAQSGKDSQNIMEIDTSGSPRLIIHHIVMSLILMCIILVIQ